MLDNIVRIPTSCVSQIFFRYTGTFFTPLTNTLRIVTRVTPVAPEDATFAENLFWNNKIKDKDGKEVVYDSIGTEDLLAPLGEVSLHHTLLLVLATVNCDRQKSHFAATTRNEKKHGPDCRFCDIVSYTHVNRLGTILAWSCPLGTTRPRPRGRAHDEFFISHHAISVLVVDGVPPHIPICC